MPIISSDPCGKMCLENKELIPGAATLYRLNTGLSILIGAIIDGHADT